MRRSPDGALDNLGAEGSLSLFDLASEEISFLDRSMNCCIGFVDMVNSTKVTAEIYNRRKIGQYYSIFINTMAILAKNYGAKIVKNAGDALIFYFPDSSDPANEAAFNDAFECFTTMILALDIINTKLHSENLPSVSYRISADYGKVEVATSTSSKGEDLFGSTMNICAKINSMAEPNGIVIGGDLYQIIKSFSSINGYKFRELQGYSIGFNHKYPVYRILNKNNAIEIDINSIIVDDEPDTVFTYKSLLSAEGYNVQAFTDPQEALKHFVQLPDPSSYYPLVLLDIRMPRLNGLQLFYRIKAISPSTKIMFVSALDIAEELTSLLPNMKYDDIIKKPLKREYFVSKINLILKNNSSIHFEDLDA